MPDIIWFLFFSAALLFFGYPLFANKTHEPLRRKPGLLLVLLILGGWVSELHDLMNLGWQPYLLIGQSILTIVVGYISIFRVLRILQADSQNRVPMELYIALIMLVVLVFQIML